MVYNALAITSLLISIFFTLPILAGFGTTGIVEGSLAASYQSADGVIKAGSWFTTLASLAMDGTFTYGATSGGITAIITGLLSLISSGEGPESFEIVAIYRRSEPKKKMDTMARIAWYFGFKRIKPKKKKSHLTIFTDAVVTGAGITVGSLLVIFLVVLILG